MRLGVIYRVHTAPTQVTLPGHSRWKAVPVLHTGQNSIQWGIVQEVILPAMGKGNSTVECSSVLGFVREYRYDPEYFTVNGEVDEMEGAIRDLCQLMKEVHRSVIHTVTYQTHHV